MQGGSLLCRCALSDNLAPLCVPSRTAPAANYTNVLQTTHQSPHGIFFVKPFTTRRDGWLADATNAFITFVCCIVSKSKSKRLRCISRWFGRDLMEHRFFVLSVTA